MEKIVVLMKQVPDTANITGEAMKEDGTVNRAALPAICNPEDRNALEMALEIRGKRGGEVVVVSMGPAAATEVLRLALYMGADSVYLVSDKYFAGSDTLVTARILSEAVKMLGNVKLILAGRQAIDGDTAQVGPQVAENLGFNQVSYVTKLVDVQPDHITVIRDDEFQDEEIKAELPLLLTVMSDANTPRYPSAIQMLRFFRAESVDRIPAAQIGLYEQNEWVIPVMNRETLGIPVEDCGLKGSPTKVFAIKNIALKPGDFTRYEMSKDGVKTLVSEIMKEYCEV